MLTHTQEKLILSLHHKNGRKKSQLCLVEGEKNVLAAKEYIEFTFTPDDSPKFEKLVTTTTPQHVAAVARIPEFSHDMIAKKKDNPSPRWDTRSWEYWIDTAISKCI